LNKIKIMPTASSLISANNIIATPQKLNLLEVA